MTPAPPIQLNSLAFTYCNSPNKLCCIFFFRTNTISENFFPTNFCIFSFPNKFCCIFFFLNTFYRIGTEIFSVRILPLDNIHNADVRVSVPQESGHKLRLPKHMLPPWPFPGNPTTPAEPEELGHKLTWRRKPLNNRRFLRLRRDTPRMHPVQQRRCWARRWR